MSSSLGFRLHGSGFTVDEFRVYNLGFRVWGYEIRIWNLGFRIQGLGYGYSFKGLGSVGFVGIRV
jgi:hypothetical protein